MAEAVAEAPTSAQNPQPEQPGWGARFLSAASSILWWRKPKAAAARAAPALAAQTSERLPEELFFDDIPLARRLKHLGDVLHHEKFRPMNDQLPEFIGRQASIPGLPFPNPAHVDHFWRHEGGTKPNSEIMVFYAQNPPVEMKDVAIVVFTQKMSQPLIEAFTTCDRGTMSLADVYASKSFQPLKDLIWTHGGVRTEAAPPALRQSSPAKVDQCDVA